MKKPKTYTCTENITFKQFIRGENGVTKGGLLVDEILKTRISYILSFIMCISSLIITIRSGEGLYRTLYVWFSIFTLIYALMSVFIFDIFAIHLLKRHAKDTIKISVGALNKICEDNIDKYDSFEEMEEDIRDLLKEAAQKEFNHYLAQNLHFLGNYLPHYYYYNHKYSEISQKEMIKKLEERKNG